MNKNPEEAPRIAESFYEQSIQAQWNQIRHLLEYNKRTATLAAELLQTQHSFDFPLNLLSCCALDYSELKKAQVRSNCTHTGLTNVRQRIALQVVG